MREDTMRNLGGNIERGGIPMRFTNEVTIRIAGGENLSKYFIWDIFSKLYIEEMENILINTPIYHIIKVRVFIQVRGFPLIVWARRKPLLNITEYAINLWTFHCPYAIIPPTTMLRIIKIVRERFRNILFPPPIYSITFTIHR